MQQLDSNIQVLVISSSKSPLTISPIFIPFKKLEILRINEASIQSIGVHSFWGVQSLRVLGIANQIKGIALSNVGISIYHFLFYIFLPFRFIKK